MRTRDAVRDEIAAMHLALEAGTDCCPTAPGGFRRAGWSDAADAETVARVYFKGPRALRLYQQGALAREIWEGLPRKQKWWLR